MARNTAESQSESESSENSSSEGLKTPPRETRVTDYEIQRQWRIAENKAKIEALGLRNMVKSVIVSVENKRVGKGKGKQKGKRIVEEDEEYMPNEEEKLNVDELGASSDSSEEYEEEEEGAKGRKSRSRSTKASSRKSISKKKPSAKKLLEKPDLLDDEDGAFLQAIALSLKVKGFIKDEEVEMHGRSSHKSSGQTKNDSEPKGCDRDLNDVRKRKKSKSTASRIQMNEDDVVIHFCQFDETGKGSITLNDLRRMASMHDFSWTDKELYDMIQCFDSNVDGKAMGEPSGLRRQQRAIDLLLGVSHRRSTENDRSQGEAQRAIHQ